jgi:hypothetical protein
MQLSWQNSHNPNPNHNHYTIVLQQQSKHSLIRSIDLNQEVVVVIAAVVEVAVEEDRRTFPVMEMTAFVPSECVNFCSVFQSSYYNKAQRKPIQKRKPRTTINHDGRS